MRPLCEPLVAASVELYRSVAAAMLPTPAKSHYLFNTRDLAKLVFGVMQARGGGELLRLDSDCTAAPAAGACKGGCEQAGD